MSYSAIWPQWGLNVDRGGTKLLQNTQGLKMVNSCRMSRERSVHKEGAGGSMTGESYERLIMKTLRKLCWGVQVIAILVQLCCSQCASMVSKITFSTTTPFPTTAPTHQPFPSELATVGLIGLSWVISTMAACSRIVIVVDGGYDT